MYCMYAYICHNLPQYTSKSLYLGWVDKGIVGDDDVLDRGCWRGLNHSMGDYAVLKLVPVGSPCQHPQTSDRYKKERKLFLCKSRSNLEHGANDLDRCPCKITEKIWSSLEWMHRQYRRLWDQSVAVSGDNAHLFALFPFDRVNVRNPKQQVVPYCTDNLAVWLKRIFVCASWKTKGTEKPRCLP